MFVHHSLSSILILGSCIDRTCDDIYHRGTCLSRPECRWSAAGSFCHHQGLHFIATGFWLTTYRSHWPTLRSYP
jgi:hypothetical protein